VKFRSCLFIHFAPNRDNWRADAITSRAFGDVSPTDVELIRRRKIVERWIPLWARVGLVRKHELSIVSRHSQRLRPRIELCVANRGMMRPTAKLYAFRAVWSLGLCLS
jgi:hypothetical protein